MKKVILYLTAVVLIVIAGCSESVTPTKNPEVKIVAELATQYVNITGQVNEVDSIKIVRIRILMSEMKLFNENVDSTEGKILETGPFVYDIREKGKLVPISSASIPSGIYDKIKIEFHRFSANDILQYQNNEAFMDFATSERYSIIIEGITYKNSQPSIFTFNSQLNTNIFLKFDNELNLNYNTVSIISIYLDPNFFFKKWESILDPNDPKNQKDIENSLMNSIRAIKK